MKSSILKIEKPFRYLLAVFFNGLVLCAFFNASTSIAAENVYYHGSACQAYYGNQSSDLNNQSTGIRNVSAQLRTVICPIDWNNYVWNASGELRVTVWLYNASYANSGNNCFLWAQGVTGSVGDYAWYQFPNSFVGNSSMSLRVDANYPNYVLQCRLTPGSMVRSYYSVAP